MRSTGALSLCMTRLQQVVAELFRLPIVGMTSDEFDRRVELLKADVAKQITETEERFRELHRTACAYFIEQAKADLRSEIRTSISGEDFIDSVVERIRRKQLNG